jgi:hypothetical protein
MAHMVVLHGSLPCPGWANASYLSKWYIDPMGPCEGLCLPLTEYYVGPHDYASLRDSLV